MNKKKVLSAALACSLMLGSSAWAADQGPNAGKPIGPRPTDDERKNNADTIISVFETKVDPGKVSYEVPLYVTLAVVADGGQTKVLCPSPEVYYIENTSPTRPDGRDTEVAVTRVTVETAKTGDSVFHTTGTGYQRLTGKGNRLALPLEGQAVSAGGEEKTAAQFRLTYTVSLLDLDGDPIGEFVEYPDRP